MKTRTSFVSNSSSSSFIVGYSKVKDITLVTQWLEKLGVTLEDGGIVSTTELLEAEENKWGGLRLNVPVTKDYPRNNPNEFAVSSFQSDIPFNIDPSKEEHFFCYSYAGGEGDGTFSCYGPDDEWLDIDYSIDEDFFDPKE